MNWMWKGDFIPANRSEYELIKTQLESERFPDPKSKEKTIGFFELPKNIQNENLVKRLKDYSKKVYTVNHRTKIEER
jgi:DNA polymerase epsilon subunit 1